MALRYVLKTNDGEKLLFQLFFLKNNENKSVEVVEVEEIDFNDVKRHIERGESIFITHKHKQKVNSNRIASQEATEPCYFTHM